MIISKYLNLENIDALFVTKVLSAATTCLATLYFGKLWYSYGYFKRRGIPTPKYKFISGNLNEIVEKTYSEALRHWTQTLGKTYGIYEGHTPVLITSDIQVLEEVFNKQFSNFTARRKLPNQWKENGSECEVFQSSRNLWKRLRSVQKTSFTVAGLKTIQPVMKQCCERFISMIKKNQDKEIDINEYFDRLTMDVVWNCAYGVDIDLQSNPNFPFLVRTIEILKDFSELNGFIKFCFYFPELLPYAFPILNFYTLIASKISENLGNSNFWLQQRITEVLERRAKNKVVRLDFLQNMINCQSEDVDKTRDNKPYDPLFPFEKKCTTQEILASLVGSLFAAFDTTSSTLGFCLYCMMKNPEAMAKLQEEIDTLESEDVDYEALNNLQYLDLFIKEVHRMYPIAPNVISRRCTVPTRIGDLEIPENLVIAVDVLSLHYDPKYWGKVDPNKFYPERFLEVNNVNKLMYMPFGTGPRICIGMKFAILEIKMTLVKLIRNFEITSTTDLSGEIEIREGTVRRINKPLNLMFKNRV